MALVKAPRFVRPVETAFVNEAPDAKPARWLRGKKTQVTLSIDPALLDQVDRIAADRHLNRAALLTVWIVEAIKREA